MPHVHGIEPHEIAESTAAEPAAVEAGPDLRERILELVAVIVLAVGTLAAAWSGYQATRWDGVEASRYATAGALDVDAAKRSTRAGQLILGDAALFSEWLSAYSSGNVSLAGMFEKRFRPEYRPAFEAWLATDPFNNASAPAGPAVMPEYMSALAKESDALAEQADTALHDGEHAKELGDEFILNTVFLASALFLAGISSRFDWLKARIVILVLSGVTLSLALVNLLRLPVA